MSHCSFSLASYDNSWYNPGRPKWMIALWFFFGMPLLRNSLNPSSAFRRALLRLFGARVGRGVVLRPGVRVKYPWLLSIGDHTWIGEDVWLDNLAPITIGDNVCISQGAYFCTGNHNWSDPAFGLMVLPISVRSGAWVGARSFVGPGVVIGEFAVASAGSVVTKAVPPFEIHAGNPATFRKRRVIGETNHQTPVPSR